MIANFHEWVKLNQYSNPVQRRTAVLAVYYSIFVQVVTLVILTTIVTGFSPADDLPLDLAIIISLLGGGALTIYFIRAGRPEAATIVVAVVTLLGPLVALGYEGAQWQGLNIYWLSITLLALLGNRRVTIVTGVAALVILVVTAFTPETEGVGTINVAVGITLQLFANLAAVLVAGSLNEVAKATIETEASRRLRLTQISTQVVKSVFSRADIDQLLNNVVEDISSRFSEIYHAQVFLIDEEGQYAVLQSSTGPIGRQLIERGHRLAVGSQSVIGRVTESGQYVLAGDTSSDPVHKRNELLPDTRTELALPLVVEGGDIIGALDIQSLMPNAFQQEDIETLQLLADQIALAIDNARLLLRTREQAETNARLLENEQVNRREIERLNRELTAQQWSEFSTAHTIQQQLDTKSGEYVDIQRLTPTLESAITSGEVTIKSDDHQHIVTMPIISNGVVVGALEFDIPSSEAVGADTQAALEVVSERIGLSLENARLFQETQEALTEVERLYEMAQVVNAAADADLADVFEIVTDRLIVEEKLDRVAILQAEQVNAIPSSNLVVSYWWDRSPEVDGDWQDGWHIGQKLDYLRRGFANAMQRNTSDPIIINELVDPTTPEQQVIADIMVALDAATLIILPLVSGGRWFGLLICASNSENAFPMRYVNFAQAASNQLATSIDNRRLLGEVQNEARRALALAEAGQSVTMLSGALSDGVARLFRSVAGPGEFNRWWFGLLEPDGVTLRVVSYETPADVDAEFPETMNATTDDNAITEVVHAPQVLLVDNYDELHPILGALSADQATLFGKHIAVPVNDRGEELRGVLMIGRDIDARNLDERDIQLASTLANQLSIAVENQTLFATAEEQRQTLNNTIATMPAGVLVFDPNGNVTLANYQAIELLGEGVNAGIFAPDTYPIYDVNTDTLHDQRTFPTTQAIEHKQISSGHNFYVRLPDGRRREILVSTALVEDSDGQLVSIVAIFQEITDQRELEIALQSSLSETTALYEASRAIASSPTKNDLIVSIVNQLQTRGADEVYVLLREGQEESELTIQVVAHESTQSSLQVPTADLDQLTIPAQLLTHNDTVIGQVSSERLQELLDEDARAKVVDSPELSLATFPLKARGNRVIGWFSLVFHEHHNFEADERRFLATLADQAAVSLDVIRLFESTQNALTSVANLYRGNKRIAEANSVAEAVEVVQEEVMNFVPDRIDLILQGSLEEPDDVYAAIAWTQDNSLSDIPALPIDPVTLRPQTPFSILSEKSHYIDDMTAEPTDALHEALLAVDSPYQSVVSVAVRAGGRPLGRLALGFLNPRRFVSDEVQFISMLADSLAYITSNELLFQQTQDSLEETGVLYQASRAIANSKDRDAIVQAFIDYAASAVVDKVMLISLLSASWTGADAQIEVSTTWGRGDFLDLRGLSFTPVQLPIWQELSSEEIVWSDDVESDPHLDEFTRLGFRTLDVASYIIVPLRTPNGPMGAVMLGSSQARQHREREIRIYKSLADQAAIQLENKRLLDQADIRTRQLEISAQVSRAATQILDLDKLFPQIVRLIKSSFNYDHAQIFIVDEQQQNAVLQAATGEAGRQMLAVRHSLPVGSQSVVGQATSTGEYFLVSDTSETDAMHRPNPYLPETRAELAIPLKVKGAIVGALDVQANRPGAFTTDDINALTSLADQLAIAIDNAELFQISSKRAEDMSFLFEVTSTAASAGAGMNETLETLGTVLVKQMNALSVELYLYNAQEERLRSELAIVGESQEGGKEYNFIDTAENIPIGHGIVGWVARHLRPIIIHDFEQEDEYFPTIAGSRSGIFVPLASGESLIGVLAIEGEEPYQFDEEDLRLLRTLSSTLSPILQNAQLVDELQQTNQRLLEIDKLKTNFLAAMSHELRTPLNSIIGFSRVILKGIDGPITEMQEQDIQTIHDQGKHLLGLVNDILDQAKIEAGKMELVQEYFDVGAVAKSVMSSAQGYTREKPVQLFLEIQDDLVDGFGDEFRTRQIIFNLISNAAKFTYEGSITVSCYTRFDETINQDVVVISVADTGTGISQEDIETKIFESFQQADNSTTRAAGGTGLGLPLSRSLARLQGGELYVESQLGIGSTFYVHIPTQPFVTDEEVATNDDAAPQAHTKLDTVQLDASKLTNGSSAQAASKPATSELRRRVILAVDDEVGMINLYRRYLSKEGWQIIGETNPQRTEEMIAAHAPQIVLLDINMPNRSGWEVLEQLGEEFKKENLPVIVCSIETDKERSAKLGAYTHITKPFDEKTLVEAVRSIQMDQRSSGESNNGAQ